MHSFWNQWLASPAGQYSLAWEREQLDSLVGDVFGYFAVQLGMPELDALRANRMPTRVLALTQCPAAGAVDAAPAVMAGAPAGQTDARDADPAASGRPGGDAVGSGAGDGGRSDMRPQAPLRRVVIENFEDLPFGDQSIDLIVLPHVLEFASDPHQVLREVDRVLRPEGRVIVSGINPISLWGARRLIPRQLLQPFLPAEARFIGLPRLRDWLRLLSFDPGRVHYGCYAPPCRSQVWLDRLHFMEGAGDRWWPVCGNLYCISAIKRVHGIRLIGPAWRRAEASARRRAVVAPSAQRTRRVHLDPER